MTEEVIDQYDMPELADQSLGIFPTAINVFPKDICLTGLSTTQIFPNVYYNDRLIPQYLEVTMNLRLEDLKDVETMQHFWYSTLNNLYEPFKITLSIFGTEKEYTAIVKGSLGSSWESGIFPKAQTITIKLLDDIKEIFAAYRLDINLSVDGGTVSFTVDVPTDVDWGNGIIKQYPSGVVTGTPFGTMRVTSDKKATYIAFKGDHITSANVVKGLDLNIGDNMFSNLPALTEATVANTPNLVSVDGMFENTPSMIFDAKGLELTHVISATSMYKDSGIISSNMNTENVQQFTDMFNGAIRLQCINQLDTRKQTDTTGMFVGTTALVRPNATEKATLLAGGIYNSPVYCPHSIVTCDDELDYNLTNIADEFKILDGVTSVSGSLESTQKDSSAISERLMLSGLNRRMKSINSNKVDFKGVFRFSTLDNGYSSADTLATNMELDNGDDLVIVLDNGSTHEMKASGVNKGGTNIGTKLTVNHTSNTASSGTVSGNLKGSCEPFKYFDGDTSTSCQAGLRSLPRNMIYEFTAAKRVMFIRFMYKHNYEALKDFDIKVSNDGSNWTTLMTVTNNKAVSANTWSPYMQVTGAAEAKFFNLQVNEIHRTSSTQKTGFIEIEMFGGSAGTTMDTAAITKGQTPSRVYNISSGLAFSFDGSAYTTATRKSIVYNIGTSALEDSIDPFNDGSLVAKYQLKTNGNDLTGNHTSTMGGNVTFVDDMEMGKVGDFSDGGKQNYFDTDISVSAFNKKHTYTFSFFAKRKTFLNYDTAIATGAGKGYDYRYGDVRFEFDGNDHSSGAAGDGIKKNIDKYSDSTTWTHYSYTRENGIDGAMNIDCAEVLKKAVTFRGKIASGLRIGSVITGAGRFADSNFNGFIRQFEIYDRVLDKNELDILCNQLNKDTLTAVIEYNDVTAPNNTHFLNTKVSFKNGGSSLHKLTASLCGSYSAGDTNQLDYNMDIGTKKDI